MEYCVEGYCLRPLWGDDFERVSRYERVNRRHLQPWEPLRDEEYFSSGSAKARVEQQINNMQAGNALCFLLLEPESGEVLARCNYTNIVRGVFQACHLGFSLAESAQGRGLMKKHSRSLTNTALSSWGFTGSWPIICPAICAVNDFWNRWGLRRKDMRGPI